jgi:hypothetical protein
MAWTSPRTYTAGEIITASILNTHVRDNFLYLKGVGQVPTIESGLTIDNTDGDERLLLPLLSTAECTTVLNAEGKVAHDEQTHRVKMYDGTAVRSVVTTADVDDTPANGADTDPVSSNWAYDFQQTLTTAGDLPYATGAGVWSRLGIGTTNQLLRVNAGATAPEWGSSTTSTFIRKTVAEVVNNSTVLQNDDELVLPVEANQVWAITFVLRYEYENMNSEGIDFAWTIPSGASMLTQTVWATITKDNVDGTAEVTLTSYAGGSYYKTHYLFINGANAGNVQLQWAQHAAHASNNTVRANSYMVCHNLG